MRVVAPGPAPGLPALAGSFRTVSNLSTAAYGLLVPGVPGDALRGAIALGTALCCAAVSGIIWCKRQPRAQRARAAAPFEATAHRARRTGGAKWRLITALIAPAVPRRAAENGIACPVPPQVREECADSEGSAHAPPVRR